MPAGDDTAPPVQAGKRNRGLRVPGASRQPGQALQLYRYNLTVAQIWQAPTPIIE